MPGRIFKNAGFNAISQLVNIAVSLLFVPAYIHYLGVDGYGVYGFLMLIFGWVSIIQAGIDPAVIRMTAKYAAEKECININALITASLGFQIVIAAFIGVAIVLSIDNLASFVVKDETGFLREAKVALYYSAVNVVILMCKNVYIALFMGLQRYSISSVYESLFQITASLAGLLALWFGYGIVGMILARLVLNLVSLPLLHYIAKRLVSAFHLSFNISRELIGEIYSFSSWIVVGRMNRLALNALPPIFIGMYVGPSGIAYFNISSRIVSALNNLLASAITVMFPFVSELKALEDIRKIKSYYLDANRMLSLVSAPLYSFGAIYSWDLLYVWLGPNIADDCWLLMTLFFVGYYLSSTMMIPSTFALGLGKPKLLAITGFSQTLVVALCLPYLIRVFGIIGAGLNLSLFEIPGIIVGIIITTRIVRASVITFWVRDRLLVLLVTTILFLVLVPLKSSIWGASATRLEAFVLLTSVLSAGLLLYGLLLIKSDFLVDQWTKDRIMKVFQKEKI